MDGKILIVSAQCLSQHDANGRSLLNLLGAFSPNQLFQIYTLPAPVAEPACEQYLQITNGSAVKGFLGKRAGAVVMYDAQASQGDQGTPTAGKGKKTAATMLLRDLVWDNSMGVKRAVRAWAKRIQPDVVLLQLGDSSHLISLAMLASKAVGVPLLVYNTEDYYFKSYDYMKKTTGAGLMFRLFQRRYRIAVNKMMKRKPAFLCNCSGIGELFAEKFHADYQVLYTASDMQPVADGAGRTEGSIVYAGNLSLGRHKTLMEIGDALQKIDQKLQLDVYGPAPTADVAGALEQAPGICYHGWVDYATVRKVLSNSRLLVHGESFCAYEQMDTRYAFSTKIADYCCSGIPMLIYAPEMGEGFRYVAENGLGFAVSETESLVQTLENALYDTQLRQQIVDRCMEAAERNHSKSVNGQKVKETVLALAQRKKV